MFHLRCAVDTVEDALCSASCRHFYAPAHADRNARCLASARAFIYAAFGPVEDALCSASFRQFYAPAEMLIGMSRCLASARAFTYAAVDTAEDALCSASCHHNRGAADEL